MIIAEHITFIITCWLSALVPQEWHIIHDKVGQHNKAGVEHNKVNLGELNYKYFSRDLTQIIQTVKTRIWLQYVSQP